MKKNIFLTGNRSIGKSYALDMIVKRLGVKVSGFKTFKKKINSLVAKVYIRSVNDQYKEGHHCVAEIADGLPSPIWTEVFDTIGVELLQESSADIIIMDELGFIEKDALCFEKAVIRCLYSHKPVLGVLYAEKRAPWVLNAIVNNAMIFELNGRNNKDVIKHIIEYLGE